MTTRSLILLALTLFLLTSCGEFAYKRGAGTADLSKARHDCQSTDSDPAAIEACLEANGWTVQKLDDLDPVAVITPNTDNRSLGITSLEAAQAEAGGSTGTDMPKKPADPMDIFKISSWWKMGGSPDQLSKDTDACIASLGEAHRPDPVAQQATRALLVCMRKSGWYGLLAR